jgi:hypothetical protein
MPPSAPDGTELAATPRIRHHGLLGHAGTVRAAMRISQRGTKALATVSDGRPSSVTAPGQDPHSVPESRPPHTRLMPCRQTRCREPACGTGRRRKSSVLLATADHHQRDRFQHRTAARRAFSLTVGGADEIQAVADDVDIHVQGDVAWAEGRWRFTRAGGGERSVRMTGVFVCEDGQWKVVQSHASIGVPNDDIFG